MSSAVNETPNVLVRLKYYPSGGGGAYSDRRSFYTSGGADDYMKYIEKGIKSDETPTNAKIDYMNYVGDDAKSAGVFGKDGRLSKEQKAEIRKKLRSTDSVVWDMVVSFKEGYGERYMRDINSAQGLLNAQLNRFFKGAGLNPDNTVWFAGLHNNTDNRHLHVCFFDKEPLFLRCGKEGKFYHRGKLRQTGIDGFKIAIEQYFSDTAMQLKADRAELIAAAKESINYDKQLKKKVAALAELLPPKGRLSYDGENMRPLRPMIGGITEHILLHYPTVQNAYLNFLSLLNKRDDEICESCQTQKIKNVGDFLVKEKVKADLYRRVGNQVIGFAFKIKLRKDKDRQARISNASPPIRRAARRSFLGSLRECLKLRAIAEAECMRNFEDYLKRLEDAASESRSESQCQGEIGMS
jgi:hypothetical protein